MRFNVLAADRDDGAELGWESTKQRPPFSVSVDGWSGKVLLEVDSEVGRDCRWDAMKDQLLSEAQRQEQ